MEPLLAYVLYKDGEKAVVPVSLIKDYCPKSTKDLAKNKLVYWRDKDAPDGGDEDYYPGDIEELAATAEELAKKLNKRRIRWPKHVFDDAAHEAAQQSAQQVMSQKQKKAQKKQACHKKLRFSFEESSSLDEYLMEKRVCNSDIPATREPELGSESLGARDVPGEGLAELAAAATTAVEAAASSSPSRAQQGLPVQW
ncbi:uncharacterized protein LOC144105143 [Amblyomma americanum]